eukprot:CAMPEP_0167785556 /NCGR_PEP_ID=MMETSP0111_2-20121227/8297_1 /TAXON_ID=91324 /ORGANISM="Lotharella globosa, Strain CCCM811" /LENGTH=166 /DNA_ID=CAMNT_0007676829 /DNA_START=21 /DNA_END=521 /DNA_ORIENTATION=+
MWLPLLLALVAKADIKFSRTVDTVEAGTSGTATLDHDCSSSDAYGSNDCDLKWGSTYNATINIVTNEVLYHNSTVTVDMKIDSIIPFKFSCAACDANCTIDIPIVKKTETFAMPDCPIAGGLNLTQTFTLPSSSPSPVKASVSGTAEITNGVGTTVAHVTATGSIS